MGSRQLQNLFRHFSIHLSLKSQLSKFMYFPHNSTFFAHGFLPFPGVQRALQDANGVLGTTEVEKF